MDISLPYIRMHILNLCSVLCISNIKFVLNYEEAKKYRRDHTWDYTHMLYRPIFRFRLSSACLIFNIVE